MKRRISPKYLLAAAVAIVTAAVYLPSLRNGFVEFDDPFYVIDNQHIRFFNRDMVRWAFLDSYASNWHPLTWISHALDYALWGLRPYGHHLTNFILHTANTFIVVLLIAKLMETARWLNRDGRLSFMGQETVLITAGVTGLLFGIHPLHVESVAWISERKDLLCGLFFLLSIMSYLEFVRIRSERSDNSVSSGAGTYTLTLGFFILALLSKPMAVTLPVVLMLLDWYPLGRIRTRGAIIEKIPFIALSIATSVITVLAQRGGGAMQPLALSPLPVRFLVAARALVLYLVKMVWPVDLIPYYAYPRNASLSSPAFSLFVFLVVAATVGFLFAARKQKIWLAVWGYYVVTLIPVLGLVQVGGQPMADRYTYLPGLGPSFFIGFASAWMWSREYPTVLRRFGSRVVLTVMAFTAFIALARGTLNQIPIWNNGLNLWNFIIEKNEYAPPLAYYNRGIFYLNSGQLDRALADDSMAIALDSSYYEAYTNRGLIYNKLGFPDNAIRDFDKALELNSAYYQAYYNRGMAYVKKHEFAKAISDFTRTLELAPSLTAVYNNRGTAFFMSGQFERAIADFDRVIALEPSNVQAHNNRGLTLQKMGRGPEAAREISKVKELSTHRQ